MSLIAEGPLTRELFEHMLARAYALVTIREENREAVEARFPRPLQEETKKENEQ